MRGEWGWTLIVQPHTYVMIRLLVLPFVGVLRVVSWLLRVFVDWIREKNYKTLSSSEVTYLGYPTTEMKNVCQMWTPEIGIRLAAMEYHDFLRTYYWRVVRHYLMSTRGRQCRDCRGTFRLGNLHVHHETYQHHGQEHLYLEDLTILCQNCHRRRHHK